MCDLPGRVLLQCMQRMVEVTLRHAVLLWIGGELEQVIGAPSHQHSAMWSKQGGQRVHQGSRVSAQGVELFSGGTIVGQELLGDVACADRQRSRQGWSWACAQDDLGA